MNIKGSRLRTTSIPWRKSTRTTRGALKGLRARAMAELGVRFATEDLYGELVRALNPAAFAGEREKFRFANELYNQVLLHADDVVALERLKAKAEEEGAPLGIVLGPE